MAEPFVGQISIFGFNFAPRGWALCQGQLIAISQNTALFALLGTSYGGNGQSTYALPDLRGRVPLSQGTSTTGATYDMGEQAGTPSVALNTTTMPLHSHGFNASTSATNVAQSSNNVLGKAQSGSPVKGFTKGLMYSPNASPQTAMAGNSVNTFGGSQPHNNMQPYLALSYCIALEGIFPARN